MNTITNKNFSAYSKKFFVLEKSNNYNYSVITTFMLQNGLIGGLSKKLREEINDNIDELELKAFCEINHNKYFNIKINEIKKMYNYYPQEVSNILKDYESINSLQLLEDDYHDALEHNNILVNIEQSVSVLKRRLQKKLNKLNSSNDLREKTMNIDAITDYNEKDEDIIRKLKSKYENLKLYNMSSDFSDVAFEYERQLIRANYIKELEGIYEEYQSRLTSRDYDNRLLDINLKIKDYILNYQQKVESLRREISSKDPNYPEFKTFIDNYMELIHYDNTNLLKAKRQLEKLEYNTEFEQAYDNLKSKINKNNEESELYYQKTSKPIFEQCLISIRNNYILLFNEETRNQIMSKIEQLNNINVMTSEIRKEYEYFLKPLIVKIWQMSLTDVTKFVSGHKFKFICCPDDRTNREYHSMLITDKFVSLVTDMGNYQSGYVYPYRNVMQVTDNTETENIDCPYTYLTTPEQLERTFIEDAKSNRIIQDSYCLYPVALYYIDNGKEIPKELLKKAIHEGLNIITIKLSDYQVED